MALLGNSLQATHSHNGFKSVFNIKSVLFCCSKSENENKTDGEILLNHQITENDLEEVGELPIRQSPVSVPCEDQENEVENLKNSNNEQVQVENLEEQTDHQEELQLELIENDNNDNNNNSKEAKRNDDIVSEYQQYEQLNNYDMDDYQTAEDNTHSQVDDFDNISEQDLNVAMTGIKVEKVKCGDVRIKIGFDPEKVTLIMTILLAHDYARPSSSTSSIREHSTSNVPPVLAYSIHILVVQAKKHRYKTKMRQGPDPFFNEIIKINKINQEETKKWCLRFRLYGSFRNAIRQVIGEGFLPMEKLDLDKKMQCDILLMTQDPNITQNEMNTLIKASYCKCDSITSLVSTEKNSIFLESGSSPELFVGLSFSCTTGRLTVFIRRGANLPKLKDNKMPDTFIKVIVSISKGEEIAKTQVIKASNNPTYDEQFSFQVCGFQLDDTILTIQGYQMLKFKKKFMFGSFNLGSKVGEEEREHHWKDLILTKTAEEIKRWHNFDMHH